EVISLLRTTERKMQYQEYDLKTEQTIISQEDQTITTIPSREDSLERLAEQEVQFAEEAESVEETALRKLQYEQLHKALSLLPDDER
ncbi:MAG: sigma-70 family RNA polymerase sigma factor, partial [Lachnospiraceae bacterium]|nr:sigma-70 family RNA polymerase sigma factor [Lachnospiraceae bacterium]